MKGNFHVQFGNGGGEGDLIADHTKVGRGTEPKKTMLLPEKFRKALPKKMSVDEEGDDGLEPHSLEAQNDRCHGH
jgi:hypothetical protein